MNRFILGMIAVAMIAAGAPASAALPGKAPPPLAGDGVYIGANIGSRAPDYNFQYRQFACIRVGHRLVC